MNGITSFDTEEEISNKSIISDILVFDEKDNEFTLFRDLLTLLLYGCSNCGSIKLVLNSETLADNDIGLVILDGCDLPGVIDGVIPILECRDPKNNKN